MEFTLFYRGSLKANRGPKDKQELRRHFHPQLRKFWEQSPLKDHKDLLAEKPLGKIGSQVTLRQDIGRFHFVPLVSERIDLIAEIDITLLRPEPPGSIITKGGDIDNRLKTLLDALKMPKEPNAIPRDDVPEEGEVPFFCLLEDDNLITKLSVNTDRLLDICEDPSEVVLLIHVLTKATRATWDNDGLG